jgi:hypothetical protein
VFAPLEVSGRMIADGVRERTTMRWPGIERTDYMRENPMPDEQPVTNHTAFGGRD